MTLTDPSIRRPSEHRHPTSHRLDPVDHRGRQRPSDDVHVGRRDRRDAVLRRDALRPAEPAAPRQRSVRAVEGARGADPLRRLGRSRPLPARAPAQAAQDRAPTSKAIRRRGCRSSTSRPGRSARASAPAIGIALNARRIGSDYRTYVLLGDGEMAEGSVWEAASVGAVPEARQPVRDHRRQRLGQSQATQFDHDMDAIAGRWQAFGWHAIVVDGHDVAAVARGASRRRARHARASDDDRRADAEGQRRVVRSKARTAGTARRSRRARRPTRRSRS